MPQGTSLKEAHAHDNHVTDKRRKNTVQPPGELPRHKTCRVDILKTLGVTACM